MNRNVKWALLVVVMATTSACRSTPTYSCGAPVGSGGCRSVSAIHAQTLHGGGQVREDVSGPELGDDRLSPLTLGLGNPIITREETLRIWIEPWEDPEGDMHGGGHVYLRLGRGTWIQGP